MMRNHMDTSGVPRQNDHASAPYRPAPGGSSDNESAATGPPETSAAHRGLRFLIEAIRRVRHDLSREDEP